MWAFRTLYRALVTVNKEFLGWRKLNLSINRLIFIDKYYLL